MRVMLARPAVNRRVVYSLSGLWISYPAPSGSHPLTGHRAGNVPLADGGRLAEAQRGGRFVLLAPTELLGDVKDGVVAAVPTDDGPVRLVRPDGYIAWAADDPSSVDVAAALTAAGLAYG